MTEKDLKKLSRSDLLEMLIAQSRQVQELQEKLDAAQAELAKRKIALEEAGSIAEASLKLNGVFEAAQAACQQYTDNIRELSQRQETVCAKMEDESRARAAAIVNDAERQSREMVQKAKSESQAYWDEVSAKLDAFCKEHSEIARLLTIFRSTGGDSSNA